jgi:hypothetical protein
MCPIFVIYYFPSLKWQQSERLLLADNNYRIYFSTINKCKAHSFLYLFVYRWHLFLYRMCHIHNISSFLLTMSTDAFCTMYSRMCTQSSINPGTYKISSVLAWDCYLPRILLLLIIIIIIMKWLNKTWYRWYGGYDGMTAEWWAKDGGKRHSDPW